MVKRTLSLAVRDVLPEDFTDLLKRAGQILDGLSVGDKDGQWQTFYFHFAAQGVQPLPLFENGARIRYLWQTGGGFVFVSSTPETASAMSLKSGTNVLAVSYASSLVIPDLNVPIFPNMQTWLCVDGATNVYVAIGVN